MNDIVDWLKKECPRDSLARDARLQEAADEIEEMSMTLEQALQWAEKNCVPEAVGRLRSREVVATLVDEIASLRQRVAGLEHAIDDKMVVAHIGTFEKDDDPTEAVCKLMSYAQSLGEYFIKDKLATCEKERDELRQKVAELEEQINTGFYGRMSAKLQQQLAATEKERDHWKANHDNRVAAARLLHYRLDLPLERVKAYEKYIEMQDRLAECQQYLKDGETPAERMTRYHHDIQGLLGQLAAALKDAERYRWLRDKAIYIDPKHRMLRICNVHVVDWRISDSLDEAIDAAMKPVTAGVAHPKVVFDAALQKFVADLKAPDLNTCHQSTTEDCSAVQAKG
jgi:hypothetical protein